MPELFIIAGANGTGKSTLTKSKPELIPIDIPTIDPDAIAREIDSLQPERVAVLAGKKAISQAEEFIRLLSSFAVETTLAGNSYLRLMTAILNLGNQGELAVLRGSNSSSIKESKCCQLSKTKYVVKVRRS